MSYFSWTTRFYRKRILFYRHSHSEISQSGLSRTQRKSPQLVDWKTEAPQAHSNSLKISSYVPGYSSLHQDDSPGFFSCNWLQPMREGWCSESAQIFGDASCEGDELRPPVVDVLLLVVLSVLKTEWRQQEFRKIWNGCTVNQRLHPAQRSLSEMVISLICDRINTPATRKKKTV